MEETVVDSQHSLLKGDNPDLWGNKVISRTLEGKNFTCVFAESKGEMEASDGPRTHKQTQSCGDAGLRTLDGSSGVLSAPLLAVL